MKRMIKALVVAVIMTTCCTTVSAQRMSGPRVNKEQRISREQLAEVQARHIAKELAFDDAITAKFVKVYCDCQKEVWALGPRQRGNNAGHTEQDNEQRIKERFVRSEKILNIRQKYYKEYSKFLTQSQIEKVYEYERKMMNRLARKAPKRRNS